MRAACTASTPELLAPAGGPDALRAAVRNGADAVYLGLDAFNARRGAANFTLETLGEACRFAHLRGCSVYLTANVLVLESEMAGVLEMIARAWERGIDAVIVQDLGLLSCVRSVLPEVRVHASTQIDAHNAPTVTMLASLGVSRVTLARELSVHEISALVEGSPVELESFVHGSLCFCHSGQCLMSSMIGGRSANRGLCAQPCRLPYELLSAGTVMADVPGRYLLSPKDLAGIELLPSLVAAGVSALKIEGRMKSPEYVASVVSVYRAALDRAIADPDSFGVMAAERDRLEEAFSRGFTHGYLADIRDDRLMSYSRPNNRGVPIGRVTATAPGRATIMLERALESRDTIEVWTASGRFTQPAGRLMAGGRETAAAPAGSEATIAVSEAVRTGDRVFRVANAALIEAARRTFAGAAEPRALPVAFDVRVRVGEPLTIVASACGASGRAEGAVVEQARTKAVTAAEVMEHVGRLGGTVYEADGFSLSLDPAAGLGFSALHAVRAAAIEALDEERLRRWSRRSLPPEPRPPRAGGRPTAARRPRVELVVAVSRAAAVAACHDAGADRVLLARTSVDAATPAGADALLPRIAHERELPALVGAATGERPVAGNLGVLAVLARRGDAVEADWGLGAVDPWTVGALAEAGAKAVWASPELSGEQLASLVRGSGVPIGVVVGGRLELMVAEHCVLQASGRCSRACATCERRLGGWALRDRKGYEFPVTSDALGRAHLYNSVPLDLSRALPEILDAGVAAIRLELHTESASEAGRLTGEWRRRLDAASAGRELPATPILEPSTSGHFFRGLT